MTCLDARNDIAVVGDERIPIESAKVVAHHASIHCGVKLELINVGASLGWYLADFDVVAVAVGKGLGVLGFHVAVPESRVVYACELVVNYVA